jgi:hypothetical protein
MPNKQQQQHYNQQQDKKNETAATICKKSKVPQDRNNRMNHRNEYDDWVGRAMPFGIIAKETHYLGT